METLNLILPENIGEYLNIACNELQYFLKNSNVRITLKEGIRNLYLGNTDKAKEFGFIYLLEDLKEDGFIIKSVGLDCFIVSPTERGVLYGVYTFLNKVCGLEVFADDEFSINTHVNFCDLNIKENPDFTYRDRSWIGWNKYSQELFLRLRLHRAPFITPYHSTFVILPKEKYLKKYPEWYSESQGQLCFTNQKMIKEFIKNCIEKISSFDYKNKKTVLLMVGHEDNPGYCNCKVCTENYKKYGGISGVEIRFINKIAKAVNIYAEKQLPGISVKTVFFAYGKTVKPPVDENNKPIHKSVIAEKNVGVMFAPLNANYCKSLVDKEYNGDICRMFEGYKALGIEPYVWTYDSIFDDELIYFSEWHNLCRDYTAFKNNNAILLLDMGHYLPNVAFDSLSNYVKSKLMWNLSYDENQLIDNFFTAFYKEAAVFVKLYFNEINKHEMTFAGQNGGCLFSEIYYDLKTEKLWPEDLLLRWINILKDGEKAVNNPKVKLRITREMLTPLYLLLECYSSKINKDALKEYINMFERFAEENAIVYIAETGPTYMKDIYSKLVKWRSLLLI